jgi:CRP/FNR family cyclic AMP-dependent transcriptional regulator
MENNEIKTETLKLAKNDILFLANDETNDLFYLKSGSIMVFVQNGSQITPVAYLGPNELIGEIAFFDKTKRSASIICIEECEFIRINNNELKKHIPAWMEMIGQNLASKIRHNDEIIRGRGIRKQKVESIRPLSIEEQTKIYAIVEKHKS